MLYSIYYYGHTDLVKQKNRKNIQMPFLKIPEFPCTLAKCDKTLYFSCLLTPTQKVINNNNKKLLDSNCTIENKELHQ